MFAANTTDRWLEPLIYEEPTKINKKKTHKDAHGEKSKGHNKKQI